MYFSSFRPIPYFLICVFVFILSSVLFFLFYASVNKDSQSHRRYFSAF